MLMGPNVHIGKTPPPANASSALENITCPASRPSSSSITKSSSGTNAGSLRYRCST